ncbi:DNA glycosylase [Artomyces pyxidatus]|uniref:DNA glycosylase n=1 Tax=Artomyces pyxidatus TaxID=48021 RepID=A0ACB8TAB3_9AGAM|nr:DNA glycosylase [Artomyces pyxidatus]
MAKRKQITEESSDDGSDSAHSSYEPVKGSKTFQTKKRRKVSAVSSGDEDDDGSLLSTYPNSHARSRHVISAAAQQRDALLAWYSNVHDSRGMPWRKPYDRSFDADARAQRAYEVWVSEIMLQQTQVATVKPYYTKWMINFPTIKHLAASDIDTVNGLWKGLGYYSRAKRLLDGARKVVEELDGRLPSNAKDMESLIPGIGRYTAGAICSIAYNEQVPVLDGNVNRLLSRVLALHSNPKSKTTLDTLWAGADAMVKGSSSPGDVNQALIELGSTVCKPREPACVSCPLKPWCQAYKGTEVAPSSPPHHTAVPDIEDLCSTCVPIPSVEGQDVPPVVSYPMKGERKKQREELDIVNVVEWRNDEDRWFLLIRRPEGGLLAGLHEFPTTPDVSLSISSKEEKNIPRVLLSTMFKKPPVGLRSDSKSTTPPSTASRDIGEAPSIVKIQRAGDVLHVFSHIRKTYRVQWVVLEGGGSASAPPELVPNSTQLTSKNAKAVKHKGVKKGHTKVSSDEAATGAITGATASPASAMWLRLDEVEHANIGTGVMKVWALARSLWSNGINSAPRTSSR